MSLQRSHRGKLTSSSKRSRGSESSPPSHIRKAVGLARFCARRVRTPMSLHRTIPTTRERNPSRSLRPPFRQTPELPVYHREHGQPNGRRLRVPQPPDTTGRRSVPLLCPEGENPHEFPHRMPQPRDVARHEFTFPSNQTRPRLLQSARDQMETSGPYPPRIHGPALVRRAFFGFGSPSRQPIRPAQSLGVRDRLLTKRRARESSAASAHVILSEILNPRQM